MLGYLLILILCLLWYLVMKDDSRPPSSGYGVMVLFMLSLNLNAQSDKFKDAYNYFSVKESKVFVDHKSNMFIQFPKQNFDNPIRSVFITKTESKSFVTVYRPTNNYRKGSYNVANVIKF